MYRAVHVESVRALSTGAYRTVFAQARDVCLALERGSGRIMQCNDAVRTTLGFSPRELVGRPIVSLVPPDCPDSARRAWQSLVSDLKVSASDVPALRKDGGSIDVRLTGAGVQDDTGRIAFGIALLRARPKLPREAHEHSPERLRALLFALSMAEERERRRIATGLHDDLGQLLAIAKLRLGCLGAATGAAERDALTADIRELIDQAARAARFTTFELSSPVLQQLGLDAAIQSCGERMQELYGFRFSFQSDRARNDLPHETLVVLLRVVRELLFNVHKHARASKVSVTARRTGGSFTICATDDGVGFRPARRHLEVTPQGGFGLLSAEAQVHAIGGRLAIESSPGAGTRVTISVPVSGKEVQGAIDRRRLPGKKRAPGVAGRCSGRSAMSIRIVLADDHRILREGLAALLGQERDFEIAGQAGDGAEVVRLARKLQPHIVVTDLAMPGMNGIEAIRHILDDAPGVKVLCLSVHDEKSLVAAVMDAGAAGYLLKDCAFEELIRAVRAILAQQVYISPGIAGVLMQEYRDRHGGRKSAFSELTGREREVVQLIAEGHSTKEIADRLNVSGKTVGTHREHILQKLRLNGTADLTRYAIREGLASLDGHSRSRSVQA